MLEVIRTASDRKETQHQARQKDYLSSPVVDRHASVLILVPNVVTGMPFKKSLEEALVTRSASPASMTTEGQNWKTYLASIPLNGDGCVAFRDKSKEAHRKAQVRNSQISQQQHSTVCDLCVTYFGHDMDHWWCLKGISTMLIPNLAGYDVCQVVKPAM